MALSSPDMSVLDTCDALRSDGYVILNELVRPAAMTDLEAQLRAIFDATPFCQGGFYGERTKRFGRLLARAPMAADLVQHPAILALARDALGPWCDTIQLNLTQAIEIHPGALAQFPHRDQDMWRGVQGEVEYLVNVMWPLSSFTAANGATRIWPGTHGHRALDTSSPDQPIMAECEPGDAIVFLGSTLHGAGANSSLGVRRALIVSYCLGWLKPYENQWLAYPPAVARSFAPDLAALVGYQQHRPNLGNFEGQCPSILLRDQVDDHIGAVDALRPDQAAMLADHLARQGEEGRIA